MRAARAGSETGFAAGAAHSAQFGAPGRSLARQPLASPPAPNTTDPAGLPPFADGIPATLPCPEHPRPQVVVNSPVLRALAVSISFSECAYTSKVNEKVDVYSFGVVLLELTTGRKANEGGEHGCLADWAQHHYQSGASITDAIDSRIRYASYPDQINTVFRLGMNCTGKSPSSRPTMKDVLRILLKCSQQTHRRSGAESGLRHDAAPLLPQEQLSGSHEIVAEEQ